MAKIAEQYYTIKDTRCETERVFSRGFSFCSGLDVGGLNSENSKGAYAVKISK
jgi:hypothetical protein